MKDNSKTAYRRIGASNHSESERETNDFYATEPKALELLLELEKFDDLVWEPACGKGHLSEVLIKNGYIVISTDLIDRGYGKGGIDFLQLEETTKFFGDIITNPPYSKAKEFVEKALNIICDGNRVAMFLKLTFLESKSRRELFENTPPEYIYVSSSRLQCAKNGDFESYSKGTGTAIAYGWFIWRKGFNGEPKVRWFN